MDFFLENYGISKALDKIEKIQKSRNFVKFWSFAEFCLINPSFVGILFNYAELQMGLVDHRNIKSRRILKFLEL